MDMLIDNFPNCNFNIHPGLPIIKVDIKESLLAKLKHGQQLTNQTALKIFKQMYYQSLIIHALLKPVVAISMSLLVLGCSLSVPETSTALIVAAYFARFIGFYCLQYTVTNSLSGFLQNMSDAYARQSDRLNDYISRIKAAQEPINFQL